MSQCGHVKIQKESKTIKEARDSNFMPAASVSTTSHTTELSEPLTAPACGESLGTRIEGVEAHKQLARLISSVDICAYSDYSSEGHGRSA